MDPATSAQLRKLVGVANYQFGAGVGQALFNKRVLVECSRRTGRIRYIFRGKRLIATLRPTDGYLALTLQGASLLLSGVKRPPNLVVVRADVAEAVRGGGDVFAKHVVQADSNLRPAEESIVTDERGGLVGVGRAVLSGHDMMHFKRGVAVKLRKGVEEDSETRRTDN